MTSDEICELARTRQPLPKGLRLSEQSLYYTLRGIYRSYEAKELSLEQAKAAKIDALREYDSITLGERVATTNAKRMCEISQLLTQVEKHGCDLCKRVARIFDGRIDAWSIK